MTNDRDDRTEEALRRALSVEAQQVLPAGDGLTKIQQRVAARDARWRWMRPALAGSVAVAVIAAGVGGYAIAHHDSSGNAKVQVANSDSPTPVAVPDASFYGVLDGKVTRFNAATGASEGVVSGTESEGTAFEVRQFGDTLYFTARTSDCLYLYSEPTSGGGPAKITTADPDYGVIGFDVSADGTRLTYVESSGCNQSKAGMEKLVFSQLSGVGSSGEIAFPSEPPLIESDPVWEPDGVHIDAFVKTGTEGYLARYNTQSENESAQPNTNACSGYDGEAGIPDAITMSPDGTLWFTAETGSALQVVSCANSTPTTQFTLKDSTSATQIAVSDTGAVLVLDGNGKLWSWNSNGNGEAAEISTATGVTSVTW